MKLRDILVSTIILLVIVFLGIYFTIGFPIIINYSKQSNRAFLGQYNDSLIVLEDCDFNNGHWEAYLFFNSDDNTQNERVLSSKVYKTTDIELLKQIKKDWIFECSSADVATVQSNLCFYQNGELVYKTGIVLEKKIEGLQTPQCGWVVAKEPHLLYKHLKRFKPIYFPIIII